jgi:hypothetical protein
MTSPIKAWMQDAYGNGLRTRPYYDFFAGAGLVRVALGPAWQCLWANDMIRKRERCTSEISVTLSLYGKALLR